MWVVIQVTKTGEEFGLPFHFREKEHAELWIKETRQNFPESSFRVEHE